MKLVIAEKPSVAQSIAKVIGADKREDGYLERNMMIFIWRLYAGNVRTGSLEWMQPDCFLLLFISCLLLCGCASGAVNSNSEMETLYTEVSKAEAEDFVSTIDKENCFYAVPIVREFLIIIKRVDALRWCAWIHGTLQIPMYMNMMIMERSWKNRTVLAQISIHMERMNAAGWWQAIQYAILQQPHWRMEITLS